MVIYAMLETHFVGAMYTELFYGICLGQLLTYMKDLVRMITGFRTLLC